MRTIKSWTITVAGLCWRRLGTLARKPPVGRCQQYKMEYLTRVAHVTIISSTHVRVLLRIIEGNGGSAKKMRSCVYKMQEMLYVTLRCDNLVL